jgi:flagellar protein FlbD
MIKVTRLNHIPMILNSDLIEHIDMTPDTVIALSSGQKYIVLETAEEIVEKVIAFRKSLFSKDLSCPIASLSTLVSKPSIAPVSKETGNG